MKHTLRILLTITILMLSLVGCSEETFESQLAGTWYREGSQEASFILYDDGTCKITGEYGTGTWSVVNDNQFVLTSFFGEVDGATILSIENNCLTLGDGNNKSQFWNSPQATDQESKELEDEIEQSDSNYSDETTTVQIVYASTFSEGIAWVKYIIITSDGEEQNSGIGLLNVDGRIIPLSLPDEVVEVGADFCGGYSYINYQYDDRACYIIIDNNGNIISRSTDDAGYRIRCGGDNWYLVYKKVRSMEVSEDLYGIIDYKGTWIFDPIEDLMFGYEQGKSGMLEGGATYSYLGNGVFHASWSPNNYGRNIPLNVIFDAKKTDDPLTELPLYSNYESKVQGFQNNILIWSYSSSYNGSVYRLAEDGISIEIASSDGWIAAEYNEGIVYVGTKGGKDARFIDTEGNIIADYRQYTLSNVINFLDGYAVVVIKGADGFLYLEIIDTLGVCPFEPLKVKSVNAFVDGKAACVLYEDPNKMVWIDSQGNISDCFFDSFDGLSFSEGYAFDSKLHQYVSVTGDYLDVYIDE